jgi:hypothetical protein
MSTNHEHEPLDEINEVERENQENQPGLIAKWAEGLARLGLGEAAIKIGTNIVTVLAVFLVVWLMQTLYKPTSLITLTSVQAAEIVATPTHLADSIALPQVADLDMTGIPRAAESHTTIPTRPRVDVIKYMVQTGDSIFSIADKYGLKPTTILFGNYETLRDSPDYLSPGQQLNILPVDGTYYQWQGTESLTKVAQVFGVDPQTIVMYPGNHLDGDNLGDLSHPDIAGGTWLIVPGGKREFTSWTAPAQLVQENPSTRVWGPGVCTGISVVQVGYGTFVYPTVEHWLSGTPFTPEIRHYGVDFAGAEGNAVYATDAGTVVYSGWNDWGYGWLVIIDHGNGWQSLYAHLSQINAGCAQNVGQGDIIGLVGMTGGTSTGPHLHFELMNSTFGYVNPLDYLPPG